MASNRIGRINEEIQRELSALIPGVKDPRVTGMISVTAVSTTPDLKYAKIYVSVLNKSSEAQVLKGAIPRSCPSSPTTPSTREPTSSPCSGTPRWSSRSTRTTTMARIRRMRHDHLPYSGGGVPFRP